MNKLKRINTPDADLNRLQTSIAQAYDGLVDIPLNAGQLISEVLIGTSPTLVSHKLNREWQGWIVVDRNANAQVWKSTSQPAPSAAIALQASSAVTVKLFVF